MTNLLFTNYSSQFFTNDSGRLFTNDQHIVYQRLPPIVYPMSTWPIVYERLLYILLRSESPTSFSIVRAILIFLFCPPQLSDQAISSLLELLTLLSYTNLCRQLPISWAPRDASPSCQTYMEPVSVEQS